MRISRKTSRIALIIALALICLLPLLALSDDTPADAVLMRFAPAAIPRAAQKYKHDLIRHSRHVWGLNAPVAVLAAQIHQESHWNKDAKSVFASGLTQFTPATAEWISGAYPKDLGTNHPLNPQWALRAQSIYVKQLYDDTDAATPCDQMWKTLWKYNGGAGWVRRDEKLAAKSGANIRIAKEVEPFNAGRAAAFFKENRDYPRVILLKWQPLYSSWGGEIVCS
jgi:soluble lytic murein transglycosylase-like protein